MLKNLPKKIKIVEVGPRDGLQNEKEFISTDVKLNYIQKLIDSGLETIEATSFVSPRAIPQMKDSVDLFEKIKTTDSFKKSSVHFPCLVPNMKGFETALKLGVKEISLFSATSSEFTQKNINATVEESFVRMEEIAKAAKENSIRIRAYISTAFGCPYNGEMPASALVDIIERFEKLEPYEISIGDTIGVATPAQVDSYLKEVLKVVDKSRVAMHLHDTRGMAVANTLVSLEHGISIYDSSSGGLGGCPYAKGATGNVATEDLIYLFDSLGIEHGVDLEKLVDASSYILEAVKKKTPSKFLSAYLKSRK